MAWNDLANNQMVTFTDAQTSGFSLKSGQSHVTSNQCMTKADILAKYNVTISGYADNQLVPRSAWVSAIVSLSGNLIVGNHLAYYGYDVGRYGSLTFGAGYTFSNGSAMIELAYRTSNSTIYISFSNGSTTVEPLWTDISFNGSSFAKSSFTLSHAGGTNTWYYTRFSTVNPIGTTVGATITITLTLT